MDRAPAPAFCLGLRAYPPDWTKKQYLGVSICAFLLLEDAFLASSVRIWTAEQSPQEAGFTGNHGLFAKILPEA